VGTTTITAAFGGTSASTTLTVASKKVTTIQVTPTTPTAHLGINQSFVATAVYDDSSTSTVTGSATWTSSDNTVATVGTAGGSAGVATPIKAGKPTVTATYQGVSGSTTLTVSGAVLSSIAITPSPLSVVVGGHQQLTATGTWADSTTADITNNVTWLSSSDAIATVSNAAGSRGLFTAVSAGSVTVTAAFQGVTGTLVGTVAASH
jgi:cysteine synthase